MLEKIMSGMLPAVVSMLQKLPETQPKAEFKALKEYFNKYHNYDMPEEDPNTINASYTVINPEDVKQRITDYLGDVLARCWINPNLLDDINKNPHEALLSMGVVLPQELNIRVKKVGSTKRPRLVVYERDKETGVEHRICYLQLSMLAGK